MFQLSEFVWALRSQAWVGFNNFLLIDVTDRSKISSDQQRLFFAVSLYPLSRTLPFTGTIGKSGIVIFAWMVTLNYAYYPFSQIKKFQEIMTI